MLTGGCAVGLQIIHLKLVSMAMGSSSPATLSPSPKARQYRSNLIKTWIIVWLADWPGPLPEVDRFRGARASWMRREHRKCSECSGHSIPSSCSLNQSSHRAPDLVVHASDSQRKEGKAEVIMNHHTVSLTTVAETFRPDDQW
ncbi:hypothetical protein T4B_6637 [Trichinella pseudospiralis]|uniref:Uncharacterized protein n=1 Tax=Trichinella pseudospiralis TaxID=6337 RepID=A0A0V1K2W4_TRIPS|nr:hypothetical protein T4B_6637 [Trichinella pseudospiralis]KRZ41562.1 hypothetical protein T4C_4358 [Trichinella pseudospiralis]